MLRYCYVLFCSIEDRLQKHMLCHGDEESKPLQCTVCYKRFMNNSALACHLKTHSDKKYYECPICHEGFDQVTYFIKNILELCFNVIIDTVLPRLSDSLRLGPFAVGYRIVG